MSGLYSANRRSVETCVKARDAALFVFRAAIAKRTLSSATPGYVLRSCEDGAKCIPATWRGCGVLYGLNPPSNSLSGTRVGWQWRGGGVGLAYTDT